MAARALVPLRFLKFALEPLPWSLGVLSDAQFVIVSLILLGVTQADRAERSDNALRGVPGGAWGLAAIAAISLLIVAGCRLYYRLDRRAHWLAIGTQLHEVIAGGVAIQQRLNPKHHAMTQQWIMSVFSDHTNWWITTRGFVWQHFTSVHASLFEHSLGFKHASSSGVNPKNMADSIEKQLDYLYSLQKEIADKVNKIAP